MDESRQRPLLTVCIPSIPERVERLAELLQELEDQIDGLPTEGQVEVLVLMDNKLISIGSKREKLKNLARGKYFCFLDDDDNVYEDYIYELWETARDNDVDVICFDSWAVIHTDTGTKTGRINASINNEMEQFKPDEVTFRKPSHVNAWNTDKFREFEFGDRNYGEDFDFAKKCYPHITSSYRLDKILHKYTYDKNITQAFD